MTIVVRPEHAQLVDPGEGDCWRARSRTSSISAQTRISTCGSTAASRSSCAARTTGAAATVLRPADRVGIAHRRRCRANPEGLSDGARAGNRQGGRTARHPQPLAALGAGAADHPLRRHRAAAHRAGLFLPDARPLWRCRMDVFRRGLDLGLPRARHLRRHAVARRCPCHDLLALGKAGADDHGRHVAARPPDGLFHRHEERADTRHMAVPHHHPVLDQPSDPHLRGAADHPQRRHHQHDAAEARCDRRARSRSSTPTPPSWSAWPMCTCR